MNVFIADDEIVIRESLRSCGLWEKGDFTLVGEASDGELALSMLQDTKPDILITDIKMPFMDGLELSRQVKRTMPWIHIVILSGYDDFAFAQKAMSLGVTDYLLKPVDAAELLPVLQKIREQIEKERHLEQSVQELQQFERRNRPLHKERILQTILETSDEASVREALEEARRLRIDLNAKYYMAVLITPRYGDNRLKEHAQASSLLQKISEESGGTVHVTEISGWPVAVVLGDTETDIEERGYGFAQTVQFELERVCGLRAQICLGSAVQSVKELGASLVAAQKMVESIAREGGMQRQSRRIMGVGDPLIRQPVRLTDFNADVTIDEQLRYVAKRDVRALLDRYIASLGASALQSQVISNYLYMQLLIASSKLISERGGDVKKVLPVRTQEERIVASLSTPEELYQLLLEMMEAAIDFRDAQEREHYSDATRKALQYIHENYGQVGVNMREVAGYVALSGSHFCTVFAQEVGMTFTEYLTQLRMEKAKELLGTTDMLAQDIASAVGYNDRHYFSYLFKKIVGSSPIEYRKKLAGV